jgi:hypothetical protein
MTLRSIITRTATITLAAAALAAPTASARPADTPPAVTKAAAPEHKQTRRSASANRQSKQDPVADIHAPLAPVAAANARAQDLRHLRAGRAERGRAADVNVGAYTPGATPGATYTTGATAGGQYTPGTTAVQPATRRQLPGPPTWPVNPQPITPAHAVNNPASSAVNPTTIGLGIAGSLLAIAGVAALARRSRRVQRARVTA